MLTLTTRGSVQQGGLNGPYVCLYWQLLHRLRVRPRQCTRVGFKAKNPWPGLVANKSEDIISGLGFLHESTFPSHIPTLPSAFPFGCSP